MVYRNPVSYTHLTVEIDSVKCDFDQYPYKVNTYARQLIVRESSLTVRKMCIRDRLTAR